jgi:predicted nucleotidyltransferase
MNILRTLEVFFREPRTQHYFREIVRKSKVSPNLVQKEIKYLLKQNLIVKKEEKANIKFYSANRTLNEFIELKRIYNLYLISQSNLINFLVNKLSPNSIILFGSFNSGTDIEESDIDLFISLEKSSEVSAKDLKKFETLLNKKISLHIITNFKRLSSEFKNNVVNGTVLYGYLKGF